MNRTRPYTLTALLLDALETEGWKIGTGQQLRVQELLHQLPVDVDDEALRLALAPLLARNPQEQTLVYEKFEECSRRADELAAVQPVQDSRETAKTGKESYSGFSPIWMAVAIIGLLLLLGTLYWFWQHSLRYPAEIIQKEIIVNAGQTAKMCPADFSQQDSLKGRVIDLNINFSKSTLSKVAAQRDMRDLNEHPAIPDLTKKSSVSAFGKLYIQPDTCFQYVAGDSLGQDSLVINLDYSGGKKAELHLRIYISAPTKQPTTTEEQPKIQKKEQPLFQQKPLPYPHDITKLAIVPPAPWIVWLAKWWPWLRWAVFVLLAAALVAAWQYWQKKRRKLIAELRNRDKPPYIWNIKIPGSDEIVTGDDFAHVLQVLRRRAGADAWRLDLKATIAATAERGGMPEFRFSQQTRPVDYLLLIDRQSLYNHRAQLYDALYRAFREQEIEIGRFFFDSDIRLCHNEDHPQGLRLTEIAQRYGDARLIVVGTGSQLISPINGRVESWSAIFQSWSESVLLSPKPTGEWGRNERRLTECFSAVLPASLQSLAFWVEETEAGDDARFEEWREYVHDTPAAFWQPDPEVPMPLLQLQYDQRLLRWIAACAIYPTLHYDLTLWLGKVVTGGLVTGTTAIGGLGSTPNLTTSHKQSNFQPSLDDLVSLFRLRWFVDGHIPQTARVALLDWLETEDPALLAQTRLALADLLRQNPPPQDSAAWNDHALSVAITEWLATQDAKRRKELEKQIAQLLEAGAEADFVTLKYLDKPRGPLDFIVPDAWKKYVHPGGMPALGNRLGAILGLVIGILAIGGWVDWSIGDWLDRKMNQCKGQTVEYTIHTQAPESLIPNKSGSGNSEVSAKTLMLCLDSPDDSSLWIERRILDAIEARDFRKVDSLSTHLPVLTGTALLDSLDRESRFNFAAADYNNGVFYYTRDQKDSACLWFNRLSTLAGYVKNSDPDYARALAWCGQVDIPALPPFRLLGPISVSVVDAATNQPLSNARILPQGMKPNTVRRKGGKITLTPPIDWASPNVTLLVKAEGYVDSVFNLSMDGVSAFPVLGLRKAVGAKRSYSLAGIVTDQAGKPVEGAEVNSYYSNPVFTDVQGRYKIVLPSANSYPEEMMVSCKKDLAVYTRRVALPPNSGALPDLDFILNRVTEPEIEVTNVTTTPGEILAEYDGKIFRKGDRVIVKMRAGTSKPNVTGYKNEVWVDKGNTGVILSKVEGYENVVIVRWDKQTFVDDKTDERVLLNSFTDDGIHVDYLKVVDSGSSNTGAIPIPEMVFVGGGTFTMGSTDDDKDAEPTEKPAHQVTIPDFEIGKYEVTIEEYLAFCNETKSHYPEWLEPGGSYNLEDAGSSMTYYKDIGVSRNTIKHPVMGVSWHDAVAYCDWLSQKLPGRKFRLPSESEWEYAARGGSAGIKDRFEYVGSNDLDEVGWYSSNSSGKIHEVGQKMKNQIGLFDMSGNVWEWCADTSHSSYIGAPVDGLPWTTSSEQNPSASLRGGSWYYEDNKCRLTSRAFNGREGKFNVGGFRLAMSRQ